MPYDEEEYLALSGVQHFAFCRRQWLLLTECIADAATFAKKQSLLDIIDEDYDSIRFCYLNNDYHNRIEQFGVKSSYDAEGSLSF